MYRISPRLMKWYRKFNPTLLHWGTTCFSKTVRRIFEKCFFFHHRTYLIIYKTRQFVSNWNLQSFSEPSPGSGHVFLNTLFYHSPMWKTRGPFTSITCGNNNKKIRGRGEVPRCLTMLGLGSQNQFFSKTLQVYRVNSCNENSIMTFKFITSISFSQPPIFCSYSYFAVKGPSLHTFYLRPVIRILQKTW